MKYSHSDELLNNLLADQALGELSPADAQVLQRLLSENPLNDVQALDRAAAALALGGLRPQEIAENPPQSLLSRTKDTLAAVAAQPRSIPFPTRPQRPAANYSARRRWIISISSIAALLMIGAILVETFRNPPSLQSRLERLKGASDANAVDIAWTPTEDPYARTASGDVVWSDARQEGYMRFTGLPSNDPTHEQYQLWIFDSAQDQRYPIDGGVFDIPATGGQAIIPINPKLHVVHATLFAITVEKPGGVVVSTRKRLPLLAKTPVTSS
jgi:hypothetical protein